MITYVYGNTGDNILSKIQKENVAILCPKNEDVLSVNEKILDLIDGEKTVYTSADEIQNDEYNENEIYPQEFINTVTPNGMPPHLLNLKINCVVILLRNLNHQIGLCNGTRLIVKKLLNHIIVAERKDGMYRGETVFIHRVDLDTNEDLPFTLKRRQFPVRLAFAMTINKSQGQTFDKIGILLREPVFSHGQLYVAFSRVRSFDSVKVLIKNSSRQGKSINDNQTYTVNVVYKAVFQN